MSDSPLLPASYPAPPAAPAVPQPYPGPPAFSLPPPSAFLPKPPRKWLGPKGGWFIFLGFTLFWLFNLLYNELVIHHLGLSPNSLVFGGFGMTAGLAYTLAYRLRPQDGITVVRLALAFLLGGLLSTQLAVMIEAPLLLAFQSNPHGPLILRSLAGVIEEACKILLVVVVARGLAVKSARNGLFLGGAVGLGFAAFEDMKYAASAIADPLIGHSPLATLISITFGRDLLGPFEHPVMTALLAAALFAASRNGRFRITGTVVVVYLGIAAAHGLIDAAAGLLALVMPAAPASGLGLLITVLIALGLSTIWLRYSRGLNRRMLAQELPPPPPPEAAAVVTPPAPYPEPVAMVAPPSQPGPFTPPAAAPSRGEDWQRPS